MTVKDDGRRQDEKENKDDSPSCDWDNQVGGRAILPERKYRRSSEPGVKGSKF